MKIKVVSDGTTKGTKVYLPDGTEIASGAYAVQVNIGGDDAPPHVVLTYLLGSMAVESGEAPAHDAIAEHNRKKL